MNVELLRKVKKHILEEPLRFNMGDWACYFSDGDFYEDLDDDDYAESPRGLPPCKTVACIAGWAILLENPDMWKDFTGKGGHDLCQQDSPIDNAEGEAMRLLELSDKQSHNLFYESAWPKQFQGDGPLVERAANRIEHLIKTGE